MNIEPSLVTNSQPPKVIEPGEGAFHNPTVLAQFLAALHSASGYARSDPSLSQRLPVRFRVVSLVSMHLVGSLTRSASPSLYRRNGINHHLQCLSVRNVGSRASYREGNSRSAEADHKMALRAWFALIRRIRSDCLAPFLARMLAESKQARSQPISPASFSLSSSTWCNFPRRLPVASLEGVASKSCHFRSPSLVAAFPIVSQYGARTRCQ